MIVGNGIFKMFAEFWILERTLECEDATVHIESFQKEK